MTKHWTESFIKCSIICFIAAFISFVIGGAGIHLIIPEYSWDIILYGAIGCGIGTGLINGIFALFR